MVDSTNTRARELAAAGAPHGTVVTADEQTEGRGRQGRTWVAPRGRTLLYSLLLRPLGERPLLPLAAALAVSETAEELAGTLIPTTEEGPRTVECKVKWPNDVQVEGRKLAGILIEAHPATGEGRRSGDDWAVIGVGLNLTIASEEFPPELRDRATSLATAARIGRSAVPLPPYMGLRNSGSSVLSARLGRWIDADDEAILAAWRERDALEGREVSWDAGSGESGTGSAGAESRSGVARGVNGRGNLVVVAPGGERVVLNAGEVHLGA